MLRATFVVLEDKKNEKKLFDGMQNFKIYSKNRKLTGCQTKILPLFTVICYFCDCMHWLEAKKEKVKFFFFRNWTFHLII